MERFFISELIIPYMAKYGVRIKDVMIRKPVTLSPDMTAYSGLSKLVRHSIGSAPVVDKYDCLLGIVTEGIFLEKIIIHKRNANKTKIKEIMIKKVIVASENDDIGKVMGLMKKHKIRRVPIVDGRQLVGFVTESSLQDVTPGLLDVMIEKLKVLKPDFKLRR
jgi:CBS domain-containing protein